MADPPKLWPGWEYKAADPTNVDTLLAMTEKDDLPLLVVNSDRPVHREIVRITDKMCLDEMDFIQVRMYGSPGGHGWEYYGFEVYVISPWRQGHTRLDRSPRICTYAIKPPLQDWVAEYGDRLSQALGDRLLDPAWQQASNWKMKPLVEYWGKKKD